MFNIVIKQIPRGWKLIRTHQGTPNEWKLLEKHDFFAKNQWKSMVFHWFLCQNFRYVNPSSRHACRRVGARAHRTYPNCKTSKMYHIPLALAGLVLYTTLAHAGALEMQMGGSRAELAPETWFLMIVWKFVDFKNWNFDREIVFFFARLVCPLGFWAKIGSTRHPGRPGGWGLRFLFR